MVEPTRFLCDQMYSCLWRRVFGDVAGREYEGECRDFLRGRGVVIATPQTALKCVTSTGGKPFNAVVIDEVHHAFGGRYYTSFW